MADGIIRSNGKRGIRNLSTDNLQARLFNHAHQLLKTHETLLRDRERDQKFYAALQRRVTDGARVLDIGAGTGIWAIAAAKLGAKHVVAVDMDEMLVGVTRALAEEHNVSDRVEAVCGSSFDIDLRREFDVVVSETIGYLGYDERIVEVLADARKRFLRDGGHIIPETVSLRAAVGKLNVRTEHVPVGIDFDLETLDRLNLNSPRVLKRSRDVTLLTRPAILVSTDLRRVDRTPPLDALSAAWNIPDVDAQMIDCVIVWVESRLAPGINLSTRRRTTSWYPTVFRISPPDRPFDRFEFGLSLTAETNTWTATFIDGEKRESQSYSPEIAATQMIAAARGCSITQERGHVVLAPDLKPPIVIEQREVLPDDEHFLRELYHSTRIDEVKAFGWNEGEQTSFLDMQFRMQQGSYKMQFPNAEQRIILCDGEAAGRLIIDRSEADLSLTDIAILPAFRRRGIASRLIKQLQTEAPSIKLSVDKQNDAARRVYEKHGFVITGENEFMYGMRWERSL